jgi:N-acetylglucosamine malate deacetylase 2
MSATQQPELDPRAHPFMRALADPVRRPIAGAGVAVVVAHPDDETIGCGALLRRLAGVTLIVVTDGAPRNPDEARRHGFAGIEEYAWARLRELDAALALANVGGRHVIRFGLFDQAAALRLPDLTRDLYRLICARGLRILLTHAYEGGHPDHDATAFAVHQAARLAARGGDPATVVEMPFYRAGAGAGWVVQRFASERNDACTIRLTEEERALKRRMLAGYATQRETLAAFDVVDERFRVAPGYDFTQLPNAGRLLYERYAWGMTGARWRTLVRAALDELVPGEAPWG